MYQLRNVVHNVYESGGEKKVNSVDEFGDEKVHNVY